MSDVIIRYGADSLYSVTLSNNSAPTYSNPAGLSFFTEIAANPEYVVNNRDLPAVSYAMRLVNLTKANRDILWALWDTSLLRGKTLFTVIDHKKRLLFDCFWPEWKEQWVKKRGGVYNIPIEIESPYPWTPPLFAFYPFTNVDNAGSDFCLEGSNLLIAGTGGSASSGVLTLAEQATPTYAARGPVISWYQKKSNSSVSLLTQFRIGQIVNGAEIDIIKISDGSNTIRLYATHTSASSSSASSGSASSLSSSSLSSSSASSLSSSLGLSSSSSQGYSSSSSGGFSSSSSEGSSSSQGSSASSTSSSSLGLSSSSSSLGYSSSSSVSSSSQGLSSSSSSLGYSSSSSQSLSESSLSSNSSSSSSLSSSSPSSSSSLSSSSSSSSQEGATKITIGFEWTKAGQTPEYINIDDVNNYSDGERAWFDICGTFDNYNNKFYLYVKRSGDSALSWSYTFDYLYGTSTLSGTAENCLISDTSPMNYPENVTWSSVYLINGSQADIYVNNDDNAEMTYAMIVDDFLPPTEFNMLRRMFHYWNGSSGVLPR